MIKLSQTESGDLSTERCEHELSKVCGRLGHQFVPRRFRGACRRRGGGGGSSLRRGPRLVGLSTNPGRNPLSSTLCWTFARTSELLLGTLLVRGTAGPYRAAQVTTRGRQGSGPSLESRPPAHAEPRGGGSTNSARAGRPRRPQYVAWCRRRRAAAPRSRRPAHAARCRRRFPDGSRRSARTSAASPSHS